MRQPWNIKYAIFALRMRCSTPERVKSLIYYSFEDPRKINPSIDGFIFRDS